MQPSPESQNLLLGLIINTILNQQLVKSYINDKNDTFFLVYQAHKDLMKVITLCSKYTNKGHFATREATMLKTQEVSLNDG